MSKAQNRHQPEEPNMNTTANTIQSLARHLSEAFEGGERDDGTTFRKLKGGSPEWMTDILYDAHDGLLPDDYKYAMVEDAADLLADADPDADEDELSELAYEWEPSVYNHDLLMWCASNLSRMGYVDQALDEYNCDTLAAALMLGQTLEFREIFYSVLSDLRDMADAEEEEDDA